MGRNKDNNKWSEKTLHKKQECNLFHQVGKIWGWKFNLCYKDKNKKGWIRYVFKLLFNQIKVGVKFSICFKDGNKGGAYKAI